MELYLLRHADAGDKRQWDGPDSERPLTSRGRGQSERLARFLADVGFRPDVVVASPKVRAIQTARIVGEGLGAEVREDGSLAEGFGLIALQRLLEDVAFERLVLVGHDPDLSALVALLCGASRVPLKKGGMCRIDVDPPVKPGGGALRWMVSPELLAEYRRARQESAPAAD